MFFKIDIQPPFLLDLFLKSLQPTITKDVYNSMPQSEEEVILKSQHFDLIYAQSGYLYTVLPDASQHQSLDPPVAGMSHSTDGIIGSISSQGKVLPQTTLAQPPMMVQYPPIPLCQLPLLLY